jgi:hypothetical protein
MRIALIHALRHSPPPIEASFRAIWPEPRLMNLLDDSLSTDLVRDGRITPAMTDRFIALARYAVATGADAILFTSAAFGPCIDAVRAELPAIPVLKPNEAMIEEAVAMGGSIGLVATFPGTLTAVPGEFPADVRIETELADGALDALDRGDSEQHDARVARAALGLQACDVIVLPQFSAARAAPRVHLATRKPVLTTPDSAVRKLKRLLTGSAVA